MYLHIRKLLSAEQLRAVDAAIDGATFIDGAATAGQVARAVKRNLQLDKTKSSGIKDLDTMIMQALATNHAVRRGALPARILPPMYSKHRPGMSYGPHSDNPVMPGNPQVRTDLSVTIFLSPLNSYAGGALIATTEVGDSEFRLPRGDALIYPAGALHTVQEVTRGERRAAVTWIQSSVRDPARRQILADLDAVSLKLSEDDPKSAEARLVIKSYGNLYRMWADV